MSHLGTNLADFFLILATLSDGGSMAHDSSWLENKKGQESLEKVIPDSLLICELHHQ